MTFGTSDDDQQNPQHHHDNSTTAAVSADTHEIQQQQQQRSFQHHANTNSAVDHQVVRDHGHSIVTMSSRHVCRHHAAGLCLLGSFCKFEHPSMFPPPAPRAAEMLSSNFARRPPPSSQQFEMHFHQTEQDMQQHHPQQQQNAAGGVENMSIGEWHQKSLQELQNEEANKLLPIDPNDDDNVVYSRAHLATAHHRRHHQHQQKETNTDSNVNNDDITTKKPPSYQRYTRERADSDFRFKTRRYHPKRDPNQQ